MELYIFKKLKVLLSLEHSPSPWHPSQPPGLGVALVWTPNPSMPGPDQDHSHRVFKVGSQKRVVPGLHVLPAFLSPRHVKTMGILIWFDLT